MAQAGTIYNEDHLNNLWNTNHSLDPDIEEHTNELQTTQDKANEPIDRLYPQYKLSSIQIKQNPPPPSYAYHEPGIKQPYPNHLDEQMQYSNSDPPTNYLKTEREYEFEKERKKSSLLDHFGIFPNVPTVNLLNVFAIISLIVLVELNILLNLGAEKIIGDMDLIKSKPLFGVSLIGLFFALLYRYMEFEYAQMSQEQKIFGKANIKTVIKLIFLIFLITFIFIEVIIELINARGLLIAIDMISIFTVLLGTYTIISGKRYFNIFTIIFIFLIMILGIDYQPNIPIMIFLGFLTILYIELSDGVCRLQQFVQNYYDLAKKLKEIKKVELDAHLDKISIQFTQNLGIFMALTIIITSIFSGLFLFYSNLTPEFMNENLELQSIYAIMPIILLLFVIFLIVYLITPQHKPIVDNVE
jgi:hypothetical protein